MSTTTYYFENGSMSTMRNLLSCSFRVFIVRVKGRLPAASTPCVRDRRVRRLCSSTLGMAELPNPVLTSTVQVTIPYPNRRRQETPRGVTYVRTAGKLSGKRPRCLSVIWEREPRRLYKSSFSQPKTGRLPYCRMRWNRAYIFYFVPRRGFHY